MPSIAFLLDGLGLAPGDVEGYAVAAGPGSFTGLRVGIGTVQGLALAAGRPCAPVSALDALATLAEGAADCIVAVMEAHRGEVFAAIFDGSGRPRGEPQAIRLAGLLAQVPDGAAFIGDGAERYRAEIVAARPGAVFPVRSLFLAGAVARLGEEILSAGRGIAASDLRALYLREASLWKPGG
jgi:tRNA threonylcarbamoyladenosine biosynthesis protein TsaB